MNLIQFIGSEGFGVRVAIVAAVCAALKIVLKGIKSVPDCVAVYLPLIAAAAGTIVGELILSGGIVLSEELFYECVISYSLGSVIYVSVRRILRGEKPEDALLTLVKSLAEDVCVESAQAEMAEIARILSECESTDFSSVKNDVIALLKSAAKEKITDAQISMIAETILLSAQKFKKEN